MNELFGIVEQSIENPTSGDSLILGQWLSLNSSSLKPPFNVEIIQYRNCSIVGTWKLKSISTISSNTPSNRQVLSLSSIDGDNHFEQGDLFITDNLYIDFKLSTIDANISDCLIGLMKYEESKFGAIFTNNGNECILNLISQSPNNFDIFSSSTDYKIKLVNFNKLASNDIYFRIISDLFQITDVTPLEINFEFENRLFLKDFINTMQPIRSFIIDSSQERFFNHVTQSKAERLPFEPSFSAKAGSVKAFLHPYIEENTQLDVFILNDLYFGYKLLHKSLEYAEKRNDSALINLLNSNNLSNLSSYLYNLQSISKASQKTLKFEIKHSNLQPLHLTEKAVNTITLALSKIESNEINITGQFYAIDTKRKWFKIQTDELDWTFRYSDEQLEIENISLYQNLNVTGTTEIPVDSKRGSAVLSSFITLE